MTEHKDWLYRVDRGCEHIIHRWHPLVAIVVLLPVWAILGAIWIGMAVGDMFRDYRDGR